MAQRFKIIEKPHILWKTGAGAVAGVTVESLDPEEIDIIFDSIIAAVRNQGRFEYEFPNRNTLIIEKSSGSYYDIGELDYIQILFCSYEPNEDGDCWMVTSAQYFDLEKVDIACYQYLDRLNSDEPHKSTRISEQLIDIKIRNFGVNSLLNHYKYLDLVLDKFWKLVFNKTLEESWNSGIVVAHGDKGRGYKKLWDEAGISFNRGMMVYLLTYTRELGDTPKHKSKEWVIDNYPHYLPKIIEAEKLVELHF